MPEDTFSHGKLIMRTSYLQEKICKQSTCHVKTRFRAYADNEGQNQPSLCANRITGHYRMYQWGANARMNLCACAGWIWMWFCACLKTYFHEARPICNLIALFYCILRFCEWTAKTQIRLHGCQLWSGHLLSAYAQSGPTTFSTVSSDSRNALVRLWLRRLIWIFALHIFHWSGQSLFADLIYGFVTVL